MVCWPFVPIHITRVVNAADGGSCGCGEEQTGALASPSMHFRTGHPLHSNLSLNPRGTINIASPVLSSDGSFAFFLV